jgi:hypothetical protein
MKRALRALQTQLRQSSCECELAAASVIFTSGRGGGCALWAHPRLKHRTSIRAHSCWAAVPPCGLGTAPKAWFQQSSPLLARCFSAAPCALSTPPEHPAAAPPRLPQNIDNAPARHDEARRRSGDEASSSEASSTASGPSISGAAASAGAGGVGLIGMLGFFGKRALLLLGGNKVIMGLFKIISIKKFLFFPAWLWIISFTSSAPLLAVTLTVCVTAYAPRGLHACKNAHMEEEGMS